MSVPTVVFVNDGTARLLRLDDGGAVELARVDVSALREADVLTLMLNIAASFNGARAPARAPAPKPTGIRSTMPERAPAVAKRAPPAVAKRASPVARRSRDETTRLVRAAVRRTPGISRGELITELGYSSNVAGQTWNAILADAGVRVERGKSRGRYPSVRYYPMDATG